MNKLGLALLVLAATPALADEAKPDKKPIPAQQPAVSVTCDWFEIWATHGKGVVDPAMPKKLGERLGNTIKQNDYKLLSNGKVTLAAKKAESLKLAKGTATVTFVETVDKSALRVTVDFTPANKLKTGSTQKVSAGDYVAWSVNQSNGATAEAHVLAVGSCK